MNWVAPKWGDFGVAVPCLDHPTKCEEVERFFGRPIAHLTHPVTFEGKSFAPFGFLTKEDADLCTKQFNGEPFDPRDVGKGKWNKWYKGRTAKREKNRSPYDFRS
ncbi:hypothetical protein [Bradyrhizobium sp. SYSU BS000235]|uniref:hypothetical protein n=1 Tax=Bradyrhizobium sp. SYSU BS000235 TaxID=3411332 RepID=UPI003C71C657